MVPIVPGAVALEEAHPTTNDGSVGEKVKGQEKEGVRRQDPPSSQDEPITTQAAQPAASQTASINIGTTPGEDEGCPEPGCNGVQVSVCEAATDGFWDCGAWMCTNAGHMCMGGSRHTCECLGDEDDSYSRKARKKRKARAAVQHQHPQHRLGPSAEFRLVLLTPTAR
jgi:hypothetical protein